MLVPLDARNPPPGRAERMSTPGATTVAPAFENSAIRSVPSAVSSTAPTATNPSEAAGGETPMVYGVGWSRRLSFPLAAITSAPRPYGPAARKTSARRPNSRIVSR